MPPLQLGASPGVPPRSRSACLCIRIHVLLAHASQLFSKLSIIISFSLTPAFVPACLAAASFPAPLARLCSVPQAHRGCTSCLRFRFSPRSCQFYQVSAQQSISRAFVPPVSQARGSMLQTCWQGGFERTRGFSCEQGGACEIKAHSGPEDLAPEHRREGYGVPAAGAGGGPLTAMGSAQAARRCPPPPPHCRQ